MTYTKILRSALALTMVLGFASNASARQISMGELSYMLQRGSSQDTINWIIDDCQKDPDCTFGPIVNPGPSDDDFTAQKATAHLQKYNQAMQLEKSVNKTRTFQMVPAQQSKVRQYKIQSQKKK